MDILRTCPALILIETRLYWVQKREKAAVGASEKNGRLNSKHISFRWDMWVLEAEMCQWLFYMSNQKNGGDC